jgi:cation-transporting ATPase F
LILHQGCGIISRGGLAAQERAKKQMEIILKEHWHHLPAAEVVEILGTDADKGLDVFEVADRQKRFGPNLLTKREGHGPLMRFLLQFHQPLLYILIFASLVTAALQEWVDSAVIFGVVLINAVVGFIQESKAITAIEALAKELSSEASVVRGGEKNRIPSAELVPGDLVLLQSGDKVPADLRLLRTRELRVDESALTGESVPVEKHSHVQDRKTPLADRKNMAYSSALVVYGTGSGVVTAIGDGTQIGQISEMISSAEVLATPLTQKISRFSHVLLFVILSLSGLTFVGGILRGQPWLDTFMAVVALAVGAIPEGLPAAVTIILAIGVGRMAKRRAIIRRLPAVETLGSTTVICSDKTGTLTKNQMTVQEILADSDCYEVSGAGYEPTGAITQRSVPVEISSNEALTECLKAGLLCNDSTIVQSEEQWKVEGDPTEGALIVAAQKAGLALEDTRRAFPRIDAIPFESQHQYMATLHDAGAGKFKVAYVKGSPESLLPKCQFALTASGSVSEINIPSIHEQLNFMAAKGLRVLALARKELPEASIVIDHHDIADGLTFLGLQGMLDPPRPEAARAVETCQKAGIRVKMITGDHAVTAASIADQVGLYRNDDATSRRAVLSGEELDTFSDRELVDAVQATAVFARVSPEHKLRLVQALQARGEVVAMTGDGVNDAPALRRANIGVAMGLGGTEVAREAADMVLTDDNFASIEGAVEEGRGVYDNLMKFIVWTLPTNIGEGLVVMLAILLGVSLPILAVQILWINMTTAVCLGMMLAFEPKEPGIMDRPPRDPKAPILSRALTGRILLVSALLCAGTFGLFEWELSNGATEAQARTVAVAVFVLGELFYLFNCRSMSRSIFGLGLFSNIWIWVGVSIMVLLQVLFTHLPAMNALFHSAAIGVDAWARAVAVGFVIYLVIGIEKLLRRRIAAT